MGKICCAIDCTWIYTRSQRYFFYGLPKAIEKKQMDCCNLQIQLMLKEYGFAVANLIFG